MSNELWTMDELTDRVAASLRDRRSQPASAGIRSAAESSGSLGAPTEPDADPNDRANDSRANDGRVNEGRANGRVREVPDARTIRWYQTTGVVDRPAAMRGRTALYARRHLLQLLAIKRLQAEGHSLATIQAELAGASNATLARLAGEREPETEPAPETAAVASDTTAAAATIPDSAGTATTRGAPRPATPRFWASAPAAPEPTTPTVAHPDPGVPATDVAAHDLVGIRLDTDLTLLLDEPTRPLDSDDVAAIRRAAGPLVRLLHERGLADLRQAAPSPDGKPPSEPGSEPDRGKDQP